MSKNNSQESNDPVKHALTQAAACVAWGSICLQDAWEASDLHDEIELIEMLQEKADRLGREITDYVDPPQTD